MANAAPQLQEAYDLIESGDLQSARQLLEGIRSDYENNPDYWWIYAHAVEDEAEGMTAIERVRQLAPNYPGLMTLSQELGIQPPPTPPSFAPSTDDVEDYNDKQVTPPELGTKPILEEPSLTEQQDSFPFAFLAVATIAVIGVVAGLLYIGNLLTGGNDNGDDTGTQQAVVVTDISPEPIIPSADAESLATATEDGVPLTATALVVGAETTAMPSQEVIVPPTDTEQATNAEPTETEEVVETEELTETEEIAETEEPTEEPLPTETELPADPFEALYEDLSEFGVSEDGITVDETESFGETYRITVCSALGPIATQNILDIIDTLSPSADAFDNSIEGFAFDITDCETDTVRLTLGLPRDVVNSYWAGDVTQTELQQSLQRVN